MASPCFLIQFLFFCSAEMRSFYKQFAKNDGFTLVELSIVIVIIGLIVSGVMAGQTLVRQASLRSGVAELTNIETSINAFKLQYNALPGDMTNAYDYWPTAGCTNTTGTATSCNGDGNKRIDTPFGPPTNSTEPLRFWQHLQLSGLHSNGLTGVVDASPRFVAKKNVPNSGIDKAVFFALYHAGNFSREGNAITLAGLTNLEAWHAAGVKLSTAFLIDSKIDDAKAGSGKVYAIDGGNSPVNSCSAPWNAATGTYTAPITEALTCRLFYWLPK